jgi:glutaredoxin
MPGCHNCEAAKKIFEEIMPDFPDAKVEEIDMTTPEGQELVQKYGIMSSPGIIINDELFSTGGVDKEKLIKKLKSSP